MRSTSKFWVRERGVSSVKYTILQHLPVFQFNPDPDERFPHDAQLINSVYLDNSLLELYHGRLDKRPDAIAMRIRWCAPLEKWAWSACVTTVAALLVTVRVATRSASYISSEPWIAIRCWDMLCITLLDRDSMHASPSPCCALP